MDASLERKLLSSVECQTRWNEYQLQSGRAAFLSGIQVFYSSVLNGYTKDPLYFTVPVDDHGFHRGDGVFEAVRVKNSAPYLLGSHLDRLQRSAEAIGLALPYARKQIEAIVQGLVELSGHPNLILRLYVTRGGGGFGVSPSESPGAQLYAVATRFKEFNLEVWNNGVSLCLTKIPVKPGIFARIKSLNYLPNVLLKAEAQSRGFDFGLGVDERGHLTEGATENLVIINANGELCHPQFDRILDGCTMKRLFQLAGDVAGLKVRSGVDLSLQDLTTAQEIYLVGTTLDVTPVTRFEDRIFPVGPWAPKLLQLIHTDQELGTV